MEEEAMELSTSTNLVSFQPGRQRNNLLFCIPECARGGYRVLDLNFCEAMNPTSRLREDRWEDYIRQIAQLGQQWGVSFRQCHLPYYDIFRQDTLDPTMEMLIDRCLQACAMLGIRWAVTHPGTVYGADKAVCLERNLSYYLPHLETAAALGVGICLENDFSCRPGETLYCSHIPDLVELTDSFGDPEHLAICYDFGHANLANPGHTREDLLAIGQRLKAVHVNDNRGTADEHLMPFHGTVDWKAAMAALAEIGYTGDLTYEIQEFGRYLPNDRKQLVVEYSQKIGAVLLDYYNKAFS